MANKIKVNRKSWVKYEPGFDTWAALATIPCMTLIYYLNTQFGYDYPPVFFFGFVLVGHLLLNTAIPAYVVLKMKGEGLSGLGISRNRLFTSIVFSLILGASMLPSLKATLSGFEGDATPNVIYNAIALWEPLFVFGWLQLRFERAFGILVGILMAGVGFATYHLGSYPTDALLVFLFTGLFYGAVFAAVKNLIVLIPVTWSVASTMGTIQGGFVFDWATVFIYSAVLVLQLLILLYFVRRQVQK